MVRVWLRTWRLIQRDAMSRTTMRVRIPTHAGANLASTDGRNGSILRHHRRRSSSSTNADDTRPEVRHRHCIKPRTFDGSESFESFWVQFENCATYNRWKTADKLEHLKTSLSGDAGHVLWDTDAASTDTIEKPMRLLGNRYSGARQSDKYWMEVHLRRHRPGETCHHCMRTFVA